MSMFASKDELEILGIVAGAFVILVALGTLLEPPWTTNEATGAAVVQTAGIFLSIAVGLVLIQFTYSGDLRDLVPGGENKAE